MPLPTVQHPTHYIIVAPTEVTQKRDDEHAVDRGFKILDEFLAAHDLLASIDAQVCILPFASLESITFKEPGYILKPTADFKQLKLITENYQNVIIREYTSTRWIVKSHTGPFSSLTQVYQNMLNEMKEEGLETKWIVGAPYEVYTNYKQSNTNELLTEIRIPID